MTDSELETKGREALFEGCVLEALRWVEDIGDNALRRRMRVLISEYEDV